MFKGQVLSMGANEMVEISAGPREWDSAECGLPPPPPPAYPPPPDLPHGCSASLTFKPPPPARPKPGASRPPPPSHPKPYDANWPARAAPATKGWRPWGPRKSKCRVIDSTRSSRMTGVTDVTEDSSFRPTGVDSSVRESSVRTSRRYSEVTEVESEVGGASAVDIGSVYTSRFAIACVAVILLWSTGLTVVTTALASSNAIRIPQARVRHAVRVVLCASCCARHAVRVVLCASCCARRAV